MESIEEYLSDELEVERDCSVPDDIPTENTVFDIELHPQQDCIALAKIDGEIEL